MCVYLCLDGDYWSTPDPTPDTNCSGIIESTGGILTSPNYPDSYSNNLYCQWNLIWKLKNGTHQFPFHQCAPCTTILSNFSILKNTYYYRIVRAEYCFLILDVET